MPDSLGLIRQLRSFWRRPKYELQCWHHGSLGRFDTSAQAVSYWDHHVEAIDHENRSQP